MTDSSRGKKPSGDGFIMQAGILAVAGILSRVIGLLYNSPVTAIIGDEGNGYYEYAYKAYTVVLLVASYSIPSAISKVIAQRLSLREYRNAQRVFRCAMIYVIVVGGVASLLVFFFADRLNLSGSATVLRFFAPTIFLSGILGVLRGYFQAHRTMLQTSFSQILEQILNAVASIWMAYILTGLVPVATAADQTKRAVYGATGVAIGTGVGVVAGLLFMWSIYRLNRATIKRRIERDKTPLEESNKDIFKLIFLVVTPFILSTFIYNINTFLNQTIFNDMMEKVKGMSDVGISTLNSAIGKATKLSNIPIALSSAMSVALIPGIAGDFSMGYTQLCREKVGRAIRTTMFVAIPAAVGIGVLAKPIMTLLYPQPEVLELSSTLLMIMSAGVIFYSLSTLSSAVLQGIGKVNSPVVNATVALVIQTAVLAALLYWTDGATYTMAAAVVLYALLMCILNGLSVRKHLQYRQEWDKTFIRPLLIAVVMGGICFGVYAGIFYLCGINIIALAVAVMIGAMVYLFLAIKWRAVGAEELRRLPMGSRLARLAERSQSTVRSRRGREAGTREKGYPGGDYVDDDYINDNYIDNNYADNGYADESYADNVYADESYADKSYADNGYADESYADNVYADESYTDDNPSDDAQREDEDYWLDE
ncbi:MAG: polysaccharide biosynthesis protein [Lachnospiraceae bacterium]|jgi:stage V sporulation protein B|nr:polysaccharide biosynthesis protein [Lachnospiraceae bacterium]